MRRSFGKPFWGRGERRGGMEGAPAEDNVSRGARAKQADAKMHASDERQRRRARLHAVPQHHSGVHGLFGGQAGSSRERALLRGDNILQGHVVDCHVRQHRHQGEKRRAA